MFDFKLWKTVFKKCHITVSVIPEPEEMQAEMKTVKQTEIDKFSCMFCSDNHVKNDIYC